MRGLCRFTSRRPKAQQVVNELVRHKNYKRGLRSSIPHCRAAWQCSLCRLPTRCPPHEGHRRRPLHGDRRLAGMVLQRKTGGCFEQARHVGRHTTQLVFGQFVVHRKPAEPLRSPTKPCKSYRSTKGSSLDRYFLAVEVYLTRPDTPPA